MLLAPPSHTHTCTHTHTHTRTHNLNSPSPDCSRQSAVFLFPPSSLLGVGIYRRKRRQAATFHLGVVDSSDLKTHRSLSHISSRGLCVSVCVCLCVCVRACVRVSVCVPVPVCVQCVVRFLGWSYMDASILCFTQRYVCCRQWNLSAFLSWSSFFWGGAPLAVSSPGRLCAPGCARGKHQKISWSSFEKFSTKKVLLFVPHADGLPAKEVSSHDPLLPGLVVDASAGWRSLYRGMAAHLMRVVPNTAIVFFTFEVLVQFLDGDEQATSSSSCNRPK